MPNIFTSLFGRKVEEKAQFINSEQDTNPPWTVNFPLTIHKLQRQNYIRTTKYTLLTFIPQTLYYQFHRFYNIYFLVAAILALLGYSPFSPVSQILPLVIVLIFTAMKEAYEDYSRYKSDKAANTMTYTILRNGRFEKVQSQNIIKGDIFYLEKGEKFPVDAVCLSSSFEDGTCFIETSELDGETNLKRRSAVNETRKLSSISQIAKLTGKVECEHPNVNLNVFKGRIEFDVSRSNVDLTNTKGNVDANNKIMVSLNMNSILLRGAVLRNTDFAYGLVIYTGKNTKIMKNLKKSKMKSSSLERYVNFFTLAALCFNAFLLVSSVLLNYFVFYLPPWNQEQTNISNGIKNYAAWFYLGVQDATPASHLKTYIFTFFSLYTYVIPISLFVTMEITRLFQGKFMEWDKQMRITKTLPNGDILKMKMKANNTNLNEELGMVDYIFSDKTGTLTQNEMRAANWFINGVVYNELKTTGSLKTNSSPQVELFCRILSLCHSVIPALNEKTNTIIYEAQSPDETALLNSMGNNGMKLLSRNVNTLSVENSLKTKTAVIEKYEILANFEFSSDRKRSSVVVRTPDNQLHLYCKGADNIVLERLAKDESIHSKELLATVKKRLNDFSVIGLRTLVVAWKKIEENDWVGYKIALDEAESSLGDRETLVDNVASQIEKDLLFAGCTAVEDRLQDQVPETIDYILRMGIKLWLLTGDKQETAINIGMSSKLINNNMNVFILNATTVQEAKGKIMQYTASALSSNKVMINLKIKGLKKNALVVNGETLGFALGDEIKKPFLNLAVLCHSVICCRVTPLQKALVVKLVKDNLKCVTLAIGDGANDVSMIQAADVGIGIQGNEGAQAVRAADYSFAQFRFLRRLLSVHGRYSYHRLSLLILYSFYKNFTMITIQWWFGFNSAWSAMNGLEEIFLVGYNIVFTSLQPFFLAIFDKDINEEEIELYPEAYAEIKKGLYWSFPKVMNWMLSALWHSTVLYGSVYLVHYEGQLSYKGLTEGYWIQCYLFDTPLLLTVSLKALLAGKHFVNHIWFGIAFALVANIVVMWVVEGLKYTDIGTPDMIHVLASYYFLCLLNPIMANLPDFTFIAYKRMFNPSDADILLEESKLVPRPATAPKNMTQITSIIGFNSQELNSTTPQEDPPRADSISMTNDNPAQSGLFSNEQESKPTSIADGVVAANPNYNQRVKGGKISGKVSDDQSEPKLVMSID